MLWPLPYWQQAASFRFSRTSRSLLLSMCPCMRQRQSRLRHLLQPGQGRPPVAALLPCRKIPCLLSVWLIPRLHGARMEPARLLHRQRHRSRTVLPQTRRKSRLQRRHIRLRQQELLGPRIRLLPERIMRTVLPEGLSMLPGIPIPPAMDPVKQTAAQEMPMAAAIPIPAEEAVGRPVLRQLMRLCRRRILCLYTAPVRRTHRNCRIGALRG